MTDDLPRIGEEPDCQADGCLLLGRFRIETPDGPKILCSIHAPVTP